MASLPGFDSIDRVICDIDGVVVLGNTPIPGAGRSLTRLQDAGISVMFVTNNSTKTPAMIAQKLLDIAGFETTADHVINSGAATAQFIVNRVDCVYVLGTDGLRDTLRAAGIKVVTDWHEADAVVSGLDFNVSYDALVGATLAVQHGATFYATNVDATYPTPEGQYPGAGALVAVIERATGKTPIVCGKPHKPMRLMLEGLGDSQPLVVGDRPETDIALGKIEGWATALVLTGVTHTAADVPDEYRPDVVIDSLADLPEVLGV
jgi:4-nitrophenyl phosphatase